jgi:hypothetical protein
MSVDFHLTTRRYIPQHVNLLNDGSENLMSWDKDANLMYWKDARKECKGVKEVDKKEIIPRNFI